MFRKHKKPSSQCVLKTFFQVIRLTQKIIRKQIGFTSHVSETIIHFKTTFLLICTIYFITKFINSVVCVIIFFFLLCKFFLGFINKRDYYKTNTLSWRMAWGNSYRFSDTINSYLHELKKG